MADILNYEQYLNINDKWKLLKYYILVNKTRVIQLNLLTHFDYLVYDGPIIGEHFQIKNFQSGRRLSSFQCVVLIFIDLKRLWSLKFKTVANTETPSLISVE